MKISFKKNIKVSIVLYHTCNAKTNIVSLAFYKQFSVPKREKSLVNSNFHATLALSTEQPPRRERDGAFFEQSPRRRKRFLMMMEKLFHARSVVAAAACLTKK